MNSDPSSPISPAADARSGVAALVGEICALLQELRAGTCAGSAPDGAPQSLLERFLQDWPVARPIRSVLPAPLPVLRWLAPMAQQVTGVTASLVRALERTASELRWSQTYRAPEVAEIFLQNYGWAEVLGLTGPVPGEHLAAGFLMLGPHTHYPAHQHEAEELYVPLAGGALWQQGAHPWIARAPGDVVHHHCDESHAMRTRDQPLLALYLWRGNLQQSAQLGRDQQPL